MLEFAVLQQKAMHLSKRLARSCSSNMGCMGFFSALLPSQSAFNDTHSITMMANSLHIDDKKLKGYVADFTENYVLIDDLDDFKARVLYGIYLLKWSHYTTAVSGYRYKSLIELFQMDLEMNSFLEMDPNLFHSSLSALSTYCSFLYEHRGEKEEYQDLILNLGVTIQADIESVRTLECMNVSSLHELYTGVLSTLGINNRF